MQRQNMKVTSADLAVTSFSKSKDSVLCSSSCLLSARSSIQFIAAFRFGDSRMRLSSAATTMSFVLSRLRIEDADHATGSRTYRIAKERPQNDRKRSVAIGRPGDHAVIELFGFLPAKAADAWCESRPTRIELLLSCSTAHSIGSAFSKGTRRGSVTSASRSGRRSTQPVNGRRITVGERASVPC